MNRILANILIFSLLTISCGEENEKKETPVKLTGNFSYSFSGEVSGHEYQDLGLSVKWATKNIGADNYYDSGYYISWGETQPKGDYTWVSYQHYDANEKILTKYADVVKDSTKLIPLETTDDAAAVNLGEKWRMPSDAEITELRTKCEWTLFKAENGNLGYVVTGPNGRSIFIPAGGYMKNNELKMFNKNVCLWSRDLAMNFPEKAYELTAYHYNYDEVFRYEGVAERFYGEPVRGVTED
jgi:hypothetical protein